MTFGGTIQLDATNKISLADAAKAASTKIRVQSPKWSLTRAEKMLIASAAIFFVLAVIFAIVSRHGVSGFYVTIAYSCVLISQISMLALQVYSLAVMFKDVSDPAALIISVILDEISLEENILDELTSYAPDRIVYLADRIDLGVKCVKSRIGMIIGAFERVGMIPSGLATIIGLLKANESGGIISREHLLWTCIVLMLLYAVGLVGVLACHRLERLSLLLKRAEKAVICRREYRSSRLRSSAELP